jgi:hypothetical protein
MDQINTTSKQCNRENSMEVGVFHVSCHSSGFVVFFEIDYPKLLPTYQSSYHISGNIAKCHYNDG